jgi:Beta-lactamase enzyme family
MQVRPSVEEGDAPERVSLGPGGLGDDELRITTFEESRRRASERHAAARLTRRRRRLKLAGTLIGSLAVIAAAAALVFPALDFDPAGGTYGLASDDAIVLGPTHAARGRGNEAHPPPRAQRLVPAPGAVADAWRYARSRGGLVSIAVVDTRGRLRGEAAERRYASASVVKSMLLAAELQRIERERATVDAETESLLRAMISYSDNDAADAIYSRVGDAGLHVVAREAGMTGFTVAGHWGNAQITAADMARLFSDLDSVFAGPHREFGLGLLGSVVADQSWGIPAAAPERWAVRFKGGWIVHDSGQLVHQVAELRDGDRILAIAVLTDAQPSMSYATETVRGVTERLLSSTGGGRASNARRGS